MPTDFFGRVMLVFSKYGMSMLQGAFISMESALAGTVIGCLIGFAVGIVQTIHTEKGDNPIKKGVVWAVKLVLNAYVEFFRGTPMMAQAMFIYYGLFPLLNINMTMLKAAIFILSINTGAYMAEIIRGGIEAVDKGQMEAARSLGLPYGKAMSKIILPQAFRTMMPSIINQFIISLKDTSLISVIGVSELTKRGNILVANASTKVMAIWICVALFYLVVCTILSKVAKIVERKVSYAK